MLSLLLTLLALPNLVPILSTDAQTCLQVLHEWESLNWIDEDPTEKNNPLIFDVDADQYGNVLLTTPAFQIDGKPVTLSTVRYDRLGQGDPMLAIYPECDECTGCDQLLRVYKTTRDECDRYWMVDMGGKLGSLQCSPKIVVYNASTSKRLFAYKIPREHLKQGTLFLNPVVEINNHDCNNAILYVANPQYPGILVYSLAENRAWFIQDNKAFGVDSGATNVEMRGTTKRLNDGITSLSLSPCGFFQNRYLYFASLGSFTQKFVDSDLLILGNPDFLKEYYQSINPRSSQIGTFAISSTTGVAFFVLLNQGSLACWNIGAPFKQDNIEELYAFENIGVTSIKITKNLHKREEIWISAALWGKSNELKIQRIYHGYVDELIKNKKCALYLNTDPVLQDGWSKQNFTRQLPMFLSQKK